MMKQYSLFFLLAFLFLGTSPLLGQKKGKSEPVSQADPSAMYLKIYRQGLEFNDLAVSTDAVHAILALDESATHWLDTLAQLYFQRGAFPQCLLTTNKALENAPDNQNNLEMRAISKENLGLLKEALADYETLQKLSGSVFHLYQIATLQYSMRRFGECEDTVNKMLADESGKDEVIVISHQNGQQKVPLFAACNNLLGVLMMDQGQVEFAKKYFSDALKIYPDFVLAKGNLASANKPAETPK